MVRGVTFLAIVLTALSLVPSAAHLFVLVNKIDLAAEQYFLVQGIYRGWNLFGFVLVGATVANLALALLTRRRALASRAALLAGLCIVATFIVSFVWVEPANRATDDWTTVPVDWQLLRRQWEYGHAVNAVVTFLALCSVTVSGLADRE